MVTKKVYLLHFNRKYKRVRHYMGSAVDVMERVAKHKSGRNGCARLMEVVHDAGITFRVARTWDGDRKLERRLKNQKNHSRLCPICRKLVNGRRKKNKKQKPADPKLRFGNTEVRRQL